VSSYGGDKNEDKNGRNNGVQIEKMWWNNNSGGGIR